MGGDNFIEKIKGKGSLTNLKPFDPSSFIIIKIKCCRSEGAKRFNFFWQSTGLKPKRQQ